MDANIALRKEKILEMLSRDGRVDVNTLSDLFAVSKVTIRMDLKDLEEKGLLSRVHGGAISSYKTYYNMNFTQRYSANEQEKKSIAARAAELICDGDTIMLNAGTTTLYIVRMLSGKKDLKIVTNSIAIALEMAGNQNFHVVLLGGNVNTNYQFTFGTDALHQLSAYKVDKLFLSVDGIDPVNGLTTYYEQEAEMCRKMISRANLSYVVADTSKFDRVAFTKITPITSVGTIVTNRTLADETFKTLKKLKVNMVLAE